MTPEQLDEIEKLAVDFKSAAFHDLMARQALPLVKALREARARCETLRGLADEKAHDAGLYARRMGQAQKALREASAKHNEALDMCQRYMGHLHKALEERDAARAEVEMLCGVGCGELREGAEVADGPCGACLKCARRERDEARALLAALKEEHRPADELRSQLLAEIEAHAETKAEVERLRKLLNPEPKPDLGDTLMRLMLQDQRKAIYSQAWEEAILAGNSREQAHHIATAAVDAALKEGDR